MIEKKSFLKLLTFFVVSLTILLITPQTNAINYIPYGSKDNIVFNPYEQEGFIIKTKQGTYLILSKDDKGQADYIAIKELDEQGNIVWSNRVYTGLHYQIGMFNKTKDNGIILTIEPNSSHLNNRIKIIRIDSKGNQKWTKEFNGNGLHALYETNDGGFVFTGYKTVFEDLKQIYVLKVDSNGNSNTKQVEAGKWEKTFLFGEGQYIIQLLDNRGYNNGYILTGYTLNEKNKKNLYILRLNSYGNKVWEKQYGDNDTDNSGTFILPVIDNIKNDQSFLISGYTYNLEANNRDAYLIKIDKDGSKLWEQKELKNEQDTVAISILEVPSDFRDGRINKGKVIEGDGGYILTTLTKEKNKKQVLVFRINESGDFLWNKKFNIEGKIIPTGYCYNDQELQLLYSYNINNNKFVINNLISYLDSDDKVDKTIPQESQKNSNWETIRWQPKSIIYNNTETIDFSKLIDGYNLPILDQNILGLQTGEIIWPDTSTYTGQLLDRKANGKGVLIFPDGTWYDGEWQNNMFNGEGILCFPTGEYYIGSFRNHMMDGKGTFIWRTGQTYEGEFKSNQRHGKGVFKWIGGIKYEGTFVEDMAHGRGVITWPNDEKYVGEMYNGQVTGRGTYYFPSGERYEGEFFNLVFSGFGTYYWLSGAIYIGEFEKDKLNGEGIYIWPNGVRQWGYWKDDRYMGITDK